MCSSFIPSDLLGTECPSIPSGLLGTSVTTHPYFIPLSFSGRGLGEGDSCIRGRAWVLYALYSWMVAAFPDLNVFDFFQFIKNSMAIILPSSAYETGIIGAEPVSNYILVAASPKANFTFEEYWLGLQLVNLPPKMLRSASFLLGNEYPSLFIFPSQVPQVLCEEVN